MNKRDEVVPYGTRKRVPGKSSFSLEVRQKINLGNKITGESKVHVTEAEKSESQKIKLKGREKNVGTNGGGCGELDQNPARSTEGKGTRKVFKKGRKNEKVGELRYLVKD